MQSRAVYLRMPDWILSTFASLGCAFLIYVLFHWLRDEPNPKRRQKPASRETPAVPQHRPFIVSSPHRHHQWPTGRNRS
jgi:hypothetical protein